MVARWQCLFVLLTAVGDYSCTGGPTVGITLRNNGYEGVVVAIHRDVDESAALLDSIKAVFTEASETLYNATHKRAYFRNVTILVPSSWSDSPEYDVATTELFNTAKVQIAAPHPQYGDVPYVQQYATCGEPGNSMHLTRNFFLDPKTEDQQGPMHKVIVHEWGHLRWGLFDEYVVDEGEPHFYRDGGVVRPVGCAKAISSGEVYGADEDVCRYLIENGKPPPAHLDCIFVPDARQDESVIASIMYAQWIDSVDSFCHGNHGDSNGHHTRKAPNRQNKFCNGKSAWEIMERHPDFADGANPPVDGADTTPSFRVVRTVGMRRVVLILDTSGSMRGDPISRQRQAATFYIENTVEDGSLVGIVGFSNKATILADMTLIEGAAQRKDLAAKVPSVAGGGTSIGAGLRAGLEALRNGNVSTKGSFFLLITDGKETSPPHISEVLDEILEAGVIVDTLAYSQDAQSDLRDLSENTGGRYYFAPTDDDITSLLDSLAATITERPLDNYEAIPLKLESHAVTLRETVHHEDAVFVDSAVGNDTVFTFLFSESTANVRVSLVSPSGGQYNDTYHGYSVDGDLKRVEIKIDGTAEDGKWTYIINNGGISQTVTTVLESRMKTLGDEPIRSKGFLGRTDVDYESDPTMKILAEVRKGYQPVLKANVTATVDRPGEPPVTVVLRDNGAGADIAKDDGVYSAYFFDYTPCASEICKYGVKVKVANTDGQATIKTYSAGSSPAMVMDPEITRGINVTEISADLFTRAESAGAFDVRGGPSGTEPEDKFPPSRIHDLVVESTSSENSTIMLAWTAVGDNYDVGTAYEYDLRMSDDVDELYDNFDNATKLSDDDISSGNLSSPQTSGSREYVTLMVNDTDDSNKTYAFRIRAIDSSGNPSDKSNVVFTSVIFVPNRPSSTVAAVSSTQGGVTGIPIGGDAKLEAAVIILVSSVSGAIFLAIVVIVVISVTKCYHTRRKEEALEHQLRMESYRMSGVRYGVNTIFDTEADETLLVHSMRANDGASGVPQGDTEDAVCENPLTPTVLSNSVLYQLSPEEHIQIPTVFPSTSYDFSQFEDRDPNLIYVNIDCISDDGYF